MGEWVDLAKQHAELMAAQKAYARDIVAWLRQNFPDLDRPRWGPHPAAVAAVIRLHHKHGKGALTRREHGAQIRAAVADFEARFPATSKEGES